MKQAGLAAGLRCGVQPGLHRKVGQTESTVALNAVETGAASQMHNASRQSLALLNGVRADGQRAALSAVRAGYNIRWLLRAMVHLGEL